MHVDRGLALRAQWHLPSVVGPKAQRKVNVREFLAVLTVFSTDLVPGDAKNSSLRIISPITTSGNTMKLPTKIASLAGILSAAMLVASCGGSSSNDQDTITSMVTAVNGVSTETCAVSAQCLDFSAPFTFGNLAQVARKLSQVTNIWTDTTNNLITISKIPFVDGSVDATYYDAAGSVFSATADSTHRYFSGNGLPSTKMGVFPVKQGTSAYSYYSALPGGLGPDNKPYSPKGTADEIPISAYSLASKLPINPEATGYYPINSLIVGITLTGTVWHIEYANDASGNWYNPINALPVDQCWGHPFSNQYHLHGYSWKCFPNQGTSGQSPVLGFALDGFPITGPRGSDGKMLTNAQLDKCHGTTSQITMPDGTLKNTYHYVLNNEFPYSVGCFRGKVNYIQALGSLAMRQGIPTYIDAPYPLN